jgi:ATP-dependent DNA helicase RecG
MDFPISIDQKLGGSIGGSMGGSMGGSIEGNQILTLELIHQNAKISYREIALELTINPSAVKKHLNNLKKKDILMRVGGTRGYWKIKK